MQSEINHALAYGPNDAAALIGLGRTKFFELLRNKAIPSLTVGGRRLIRHDDLVAFLAKLPCDAA